MLSADIQTDRLILAILSEDEVDEDYRGWMSDPEVVRYLETRGGSPTIAALREYVASMRASDDSYFFGMFLRDGRRHIGNIKLGPVSALHNRASIGLVIGDKASWGQGYAAEAVGALAAWGFDVLGLDKITAGSYARNLGSIRAFQRHGFRIEGVQRSQVRLDDGTRDDVVILGRTRDDDDEPTR
jgi:RimJ/RimL family protein N-acetyltransferase